ncbi:hypothetical protein NLU13_3926 [Sarocladium strictum]|uniref:Uncharacterized protein n=1 Tax=Sarocladium strictum TaxID=5046 RepID=A0AA39GI99_SARSR|nr:hypothetical protein NLU13_3926 [Sarocladium strictum]
MAKDLVFVVGANPDQLKATAASARQIKSHLARQAWKAFVNPETRRRRGRKPRSAASLPLRIEFTISEVSERSSSTEDDNQATSSRRQLVQPPRIEYYLGGGRCDPFMTYPVRDLPIVPLLVDHYLVHMAVDIPELDQPGSRGLLRTRWFPLVTTEAASFYAILLLSASNIAALRHDNSSAYNVLQLKANAIASINDAFCSGDRTRVSDAMIGAVAKMASYEAMQGDIESYRVHMAGVKRMVDLRGGLETLGLGGLLRRIIVWIDLNGAFLTKEQRFFPGQTFGGEDGEVEPNPERFIAP